MKISENGLIDSENIKNSALSGARALTMRTAASQVLRIINSLFLSRLLLPEDYGIFGVIAYLTGMSMFLGDVGLTAALIRQNHEPEKDEVFTVFCVQQFLTLIVTLALIVASPLIVRVYNLPSGTQTLLVVMSIGLFLSSLRIIPMMMLERALRFSDIARCEFIESIAQTLSSVTLAFMGCGPWSLVGGGIVRGAVGLMLIFLASPWRPRGKFRLAVVKNLLGFGVAFQANALLPSILGGWLPLFVSRMLGTVPLGLVNWSSNLAQTPIVLTSALNRVAFPSYSRLQDDPKALSYYLHLSLHRLNSILELAAPLMIIACPVLIPLLFGPKWISATSLAQWFILESVFLSLIGLMASAQNAMGRATERLIITAISGVFRWTVGFFAIRNFGMIGIGPVVCLISFGELLLSSICLQRRDPDGMSPLRGVMIPLIANYIALLVSLELPKYYIKNSSLWIQVIISFVIFISFIVIREVSGKQRPIFKDARYLLSMIRPARAK